MSDHICLYPDCQEKTGTFKIIRLDGEEIELYYTYFDKHDDLMRFGSNN